MRTRLTVLMGLIVTACFIVDIWRSNARQVKLQSHLSRLEFWQRHEFGKSNWKDLFRAQAWRGVLGRRPVAKNEIEREYEALVSLGYMTNCSFILGVSITNAGEFTSLDRRIRAANFSDKHWQLYLVSNRIDGRICMTDVPAWEGLLRIWNAERIGPQPDDPANESQPLRPATNLTSPAARSRR